LNLQLSSFGEKYDFIIGIKNTSEIIICSRDIIFKNSTLIEDKEIIAITVNYSYDVVCEALKILYALENYGNREIQLCDKQLEELIEFTKKYNMKNVYEKVIETCRTKKEGKYQLHPNKCFEIDDLVDFGCSEYDFSSLAKEEFMQRYQNLNRRDVMLVGELYDRDAKRRKLDS